jgi:hypothetical protein
MIDYSLILSHNYSGKTWSIAGNDYSTLSWLDESPKPTQAELDSQWTAVENYINSNKYKEQRAVEYPSIGDQLDALWKGGDAAEEMLAKVQAVKLKYPKE